MWSLEEILAGYPQPPAISASDVLQTTKSVSERLPMFIVLDDDPTGTQSVSDLPVLTSWSVEDCLWGIEQGKSAIYVMTNSRSLSPHDAQCVIQDAVHNVHEAARQSGVELAFVSRSDSTLRGHFPLEPNTIADELKAFGIDIDGIVLVPAFPEAGRITVGGIHYSRKDGQYLEVADSEFARDATFSFKSSRISEWVEELSEGTYSAKSVICPDLNCVRTQPEELLGHLMSLENRQVIAPDCACEEDLRAISKALIEAEAKGKRFIYRVGPPFMRARLGQDYRPPLQRDDIDQVRNQDLKLAKGGLIVVGSHVEVTNAQLGSLISELSLSRLEINVDNVIDDSKREEYLRKIADTAINALLEGSVLISTSRRVRTGVDRDTSLAIARLVSESVVNVVRRVIRNVRPRYVVAKGGITSSDVASKGLDIHKAMCVGPMLDGIVSLWTAYDGPAQGIPYVVFPGNVGGVDALTQVVRKLM